MYQQRLTVLTVLTICLLLAVGCPKKPVEPPTPPEPQVESPPEPPAETTKPPVEERPTFQPQPEPEVEELPDIDAINRSGALRTVYFEFDSHELTPETRSTLQRNADWLKTNGPFAIRVEGHCDERGTIEYNIALGERRASAVRDYLVSLGVRAAGIRIVSYGEERPVDPGHTDSAWSKNRRAEFVVESRG